MLFSACIVCLLETNNSGGGKNFRGLIGTQEKRKQKEKKRTTLETMIM
jgi:hypothetical protein